MSYSVCIISVFIIFKCICCQVGSRRTASDLYPDRRERQEVNFDDLLDKPSVIYFTHNACHYCTQIIAMLKRADKKFGSDDLQIMGVNVMAKDKKLVEAYKIELGFTFSMFAGNRSDVLKAYKIYYVPKLIFVDRHKIVRQIVGHYIHTPELEQYIKEIMGIN